MPVAGIFRIQLRTGACLDQDNLLGIDAFGELRVPGDLLLAECLRVRLIHAREVADERFGLWRAARFVRFVPFAEIPVIDGSDCLTMLAIVLDELLGTGKVEPSREE